MTDPDRYIVPRGPWLHYRRKVPDLLRGPVGMRESTCKLKVRVPPSGEKPWPDEARAKRDTLEAADDALWASLIAGEAEDHAKARLAHERARTLCATTPFAYRPLSEQLAAPDVDDLVARLEAAAQLEGRGVSPERAAEALLGGAEAPPFTLSDLHERYMATRGAADLEGKEEDQAQVYLSTKARAVEDAKRAFGGDVACDELGEGHRDVLLAWWRGRTRPPEDAAPDGADDEEALAFEAGRDWSAARGKPVSVTTARKGITVFAGMWRAYHEDQRRRDRASLFRGLSLESGRATKIRALIEGEAKVPGFTRGWLEDRMLTAEALADLDPDERAIVIVCADLGLRPGEVANRLPGEIRLGHAVPYLDVRHRKERHLKTAESQRELPLGPASLEALRRFPGGFPRYRAKRTLSANLSNWLDRQGLRETPAHVMYSCRHGFMDRMISAKIDPEIRQVLIGHVVRLEGKPTVVYGGQASLPERRALLEPVYLRVDPSVWALPGWPEPVQLDA